MGVCEDPRQPKPSAGILPRATALRHMSPRCRPPYEDIDIDQSKCFAWIARTSYAWQHSALHRGFRLHPLSHLQEL